MRFACDQADVKLEGVTVESATGDYASIPANVFDIETSNSLVAQTLLDKSGARFPGMSAHAFLLLRCRYSRQGAYANVSRGGSWHEISALRDPHNCTEIVDRGSEAGKSSLCELRFVVFTSPL